MTECHENFMYYINIINSFFEAFSPWIVGNEILSWHNEPLVKRHHVYNKDNKVLYSFLHTVHLSQNTLLLNNPLN